MGEPLAADPHDRSRWPHNPRSMVRCGQCVVECKHEEWRYVVGCLPEGGVAEGEECTGCGLSTW